YVIASRQLQPALIAAIVVGVLLAVYRLIRRQRLQQVLTGFLGLAIAAGFSAWTGQAENFFLPGLITNVVYGSAFVVSILVRWPLLGVIVGPIMGTGMRWRRDPVLVRAYSRGSWLWVLLNLVRAAILLPLIANDALWGLAASGAFFYVLVIGTILGSWFIMKRAIPADHPGLRHPVGDPKSTDK
ncbi:MAG: DUF3159 domain-containing protein, partial [Actinobacteria bacterium]|nr:DUF3159 domain-containing protein [Actinomycetota bacterium]